jgi:hypothetical protein
MVVEGVMLILSQNHALQRSPNLPFPETIMNRAFSQIWPARRQGRGRLTSTQTTQKTVSIRQFLSGAPVVRQ